MNENIGLKMKANQGRTIVIIGAGPSGIMAGITIKEHASEDLKVIIVDRLDRLGKKLLATGNGRCNFSNQTIQGAAYNNPEFAQKIINNFDQEKIRSWFERKGLIIRTDSEGRMYPFTDNASSVLDLLRLELRKNNIEIIVNFDVKRFYQEDDKFVIQSTNNHYLKADELIIANGGMASPVLGSNGSGYKLLKPWKINITELSPGLVGLKVKPNDIKGLSGLRTKAKLTVVDKKTKQLVFTEYGEIQFKDDGISGIVVMNSSSKIVRMKNAPLLLIDFVPQMALEDLNAYLKQKCFDYPDYEITTILIGLCHNSLTTRLLQKASINLTCLNRDLTKNDLKNLVSILKNYSLEYISTYDFNRAQVTVGGIDIEEINQETLELKKIPNVYVCGEIIDIDGMCGGYNLHFAFASGYQVGKAIVHKYQNGENKDGRCTEKTS